MGTANIKVRAINQCGDSDFSENYEVTVDNTVGVAELPDNINVNIYPNPSKGEFVLDLSSSETENLNVSIHNMLGEKVYARTGIRFTGRYTSNLNVENLREGLYFLIIEGNDLYLARKVIIRK
jgi:hypothetical protein